MAFSSSINISSVVLVIFTTFFLLLATKANSQKNVSFNFTKFTSGDSTITLQGDAKVSPNGVLDMTYLNQHGVGRVLYSSLVPIWDSKTGNVASFETSFSFKLFTWRNLPAGDGLVFFLTDQASATIPNNSTKGLLGVVDPENAFNRFVGVEFDNYVNPWDPNYAHVGIDVNSLYSTEIMKWRWEHKYSTTVKVKIMYNPLSSTLTVVVTDEDGQVSTLSQMLDLKCLLPETVMVGISASSLIGQALDIYSWSFSSVLDTTTRSSLDSINSITASH